MAAQYIEVIASFSPDGDIRPMAFVWPDGRRFAIDRILDIRPAASRKAGGRGIRYLCRVREKDILLFLDDKKWFYEVADTHIQ